MERKNTFSTKYSAVIFDNGTGTAHSKVPYAQKSNTTAKIRVPVQKTGRWHKKLWWIIKYRTIL